MAVRYNPTTLTSVYAALAPLNANFAALATLFDLVVMRDGRPNNGMLANLDLNNFKLLNLANAVANSDAPNLGQVKGLIAAIPTTSGPPGAPGAPGATSLSLGLATAVSSTNLSTLSGINMFHTEGYTSTADGGEAWYRRKALIEASEPGMLTSSDGVRLGLVTTQDLTIEMFGGRANDSSSGAKTANDAAITAANTFGSIVQDVYYGTVWSLKFPNAAYYFGDLAGHDFKLTRRWSGAASGSAVGGGVLRTQLIIPNGCKFLRVHAYNTTGETVEGTPTTAGSGSMFIDLDFVGNGGVTPVPGTPNSTGYAIHPRTPITVWNCRFRYHFNAIFNNAAAGGGGAIEGQANHCQYFLCSFEQNYNAGVWHEDAPDDNVASFTHCNFIANARCGLYLGVFLGSNIAPTCHFRDNGARTDFFNVSSQCTYGGNRYYVNETATMATTDSALRTGNPSTNSLWTFASVGGVHPNYPDFTTFTGPFQKGGPVVADRTTNAKHTAVGYYGEGAQPPFFWNSSCFIAPGTCGNGNIGAGLSMENGRLTTLNDVVLGKTKLDFLSGSVGNNLNIHNNAPNAAGLVSEVRLSQGFESDGVTPLDLVGVYAYPGTNDPATTDTQVILRTRTVGGGTMTDRVQWDPGNATYRPSVTNNWGLGLPSFEWKNLYVRTGVFVNGVKIIGTRVTGWTADTGTLKRNANATYAPGATLTFSGTYVQAEHTAMATRLIAVEAALRDATQTIKALKDDLINHGIIGT